MYVGDIAMLLQERVLEHWNDKLKEVNHSYKYVFAYVFEFSTVYTFSVIYNFKDTIKI